MFATPDSTAPTFVFAGQVPAQHRPTVVVVNSPYRGSVDIFDDQTDDSLPDVDFVIPGEDRRLHLHRVVLLQASKTLKALFHCKASAHGKYDSETHSVEWMFGQDCDTEEKRKVLIKWLRFCYGEDQSFTLEECPMAMTCLAQLDLTCRKPVEKMITEFMTDIAKKDFKAAIKMLKACSEHPECCDLMEEGIRLDVALARILFSVSNVSVHYESVVEHCLMELPPFYLDHVQYLEFDPQYSEFSLRMKYFERHRNEMSEEDKRAVFINFNMMKLTSQDLKKLRSLHALSSDELLDAFERSLKKREDGQCAL